MIGHGRGTAAITILNALFTGTGAAAGIDLVAEATVHLTAARATTIEIADRATDTPLARATVAAALTEWGGSQPYAAQLTVRSHIPVAKGLKSSSGVGVAIARATADALDRSPSSLEVARLSADVAQRIGLSATGAFDDCLAAAESGVQVTENATRRRVRADAVGEGWRVLLAVPPSEHRPSPEFRGAFLAMAPQAAIAESAARGGDFWTAMRENTALVERAMRYEYGAVRRELDEARAIAAGVSGMGPALAAVVLPANEAAARRILAALGGPVHAVAFSSCAPAGGHRPDP